MFREKFALPNLQTHVDAGTNVAVSVAEYFNTMLDTSMDWKMAEKVRSDWGGAFCLKGIMLLGRAAVFVRFGSGWATRRRTHSRQIAGRNRAEYAPDGRDITGAT
jgi:L-lactate dehydrogenase (cytochrome)